MSTWITPPATPPWSQPPAPGCWRMPVRRTASVALTRVSRVATSSRWAAPWNSRRSTRRDTRAHAVCLLAHGDAPALFCGDTLFNAGAGNCHNGGDPGLLYETFVNQLANLPDGTRVYPGHEYMARNLAFTLDREPGNAEAAHALASARAHDPAHAHITTMGEEKRVNAFLRLQNPEIVATLREKFPRSARNPMRARCS